MSNQRVLRSSKRKALASVPKELVEVLSISSSDDDDDDNGGKKKKDARPRKKLLTGKSDAAPNSLDWKRTTTATTRIHSAAFRSDEHDVAIDDGNNDDDEDSDDDIDDVYIEVRKETTTTTISKTSRRRKAGANTDLGGGSSDNKENTPSKPPGRIDLVKSRDHQKSVASTAFHKRDDSPQKAKQACGKNLSTSATVTTRTSSPCSDSDDDDDDDLLISNPFSFQPIKRTPLKIRSNDTSRGSSTPPRAAATTTTQDTTPVTKNKGIKSDRDEDDDNEDDEILSPVLKRRESRRQLTLSSALEQNSSMDESDDEDCSDEKPQGQGQDKQGQQKQQQGQSQENIMVLLDSDDEDDPNLQTPTTTTNSSNFGFASRSGPTVNSDTLDAVRRARQARQALSAAQLVDASTVTAQAEAEAASSPSQVEVLTTPSPTVLQSSTGAPVQPTQAPKGRSIYVTLRCQPVGASAGVQITKDKYSLRIQCGDAVEVLHDSFRQKFAADNPQMQIQRLVLHFDGCALQEQRTVQSYELEDDDLIDVLVHVAFGGKPAASPSKGKTMLLKIRSNMAPASRGDKLAQQQCSLRVRSTDTVQRLLESYTNKFAADNPQLHLQHVVFQFDGESLSEQRTVQSYEMEDEDLIDAIVTVTRGTAARVTRSSRAMEATVTTEAATVRSPRGKPIRVIVETSTDDASFIGKGQFAFRIRCTDKVQKLLESYQQGFCLRNPHFPTRDVSLRSFQTGETLQPHWSLESHGYNKDAFIQGVVSSQSNLEPSRVKSNRRPARAKSIQVTLRTHWISCLTPQERRYQEYSLDINSKEKVQSLVARYRQLLQGTPRIQSILIKWKGQALQEDRTLQSYGIQSGEVMDAMVTEMAPPPSAPPAALCESARNWLASRGLA